MRDDLSVHRWPEPVSGAYHADDERWPDEVIVDFPAMASIVDRMQAAFFAGEPARASVSAEVALTPRQAFQGDRVAVQVPLRRACLTCEGRGELWDQVCTECTGTGHRVSVESVQVFVPGGVRDGARFRLRVVVPPALSTAVDLRVRIR